MSILFTNIEATNYFSNRITLFDNIALKLVEIIKTHRSSPPFIKSKFSTLRERQWKTSVQFVLIWWLEAGSAQFVVIVFIGHASWLNCKCEYFCFLAGSTRFYRTHFKKNLWVDLSSHRPNQYQKILKLIEILSNWIECILIFNFIWSHQFQSSTLPNLSA